jgi:hypothetical protein
LAGQVLWQFSQPTSGNAQDAASIAVYSDGAQSGQQTPSYMTFSTSDTTNGGGNTERMRIDSVGNVGVGLTPSYRLDVSAPATSVAKFASTNAGSSAIIRFADNVAETGYVGSGSALLSTAARTDFGIVAVGALVFGSNNTERMRITAAGVIQDGAGLELGYRNLPRVTSTTVVSTARGKRIALSAVLNIPGTSYSDGVSIAAGDIISFYNNTGSALILTAGANLSGTAGTTPTMYKDGTATNVASVSLAARGSCTIWYNTATEVIVGGSVT